MGKSLTSAQIGVQDPTTGKTMISYPDGGSATGDRIFNASLPTGSMVKTSQAYGSPTITIDSRNSIKEEEILLSKTIPGFVLFLCLDETGSIGTLGASRGIEIIDSFKEKVGNRKILGCGFVSFGDVMCQTFPIDNIEKTRAALQQAVEKQGYPFFCDGGGDTPENGVDALSVAIKQIAESQVAQSATKKYIYLKTDTWGFAHNQASAADVKLALNSGRITKTFLEFNNSGSQEGTSYSLSFPESTYISHQPFKLS